ncbi:M24 family metallopeptidase [Paraglaciecola sp. 2405UD69-4]|uniref:M24 family metallopeptidase n=1 Tax=Paraglaciecola sp. 2405UD69-4 TaxID=3391836 RepID=UPI0039C907C6
MVNRRELLKGALVAGSAVALGGGATKATANWGMAEPKPNFDGRLLVNKPHAYKVLEQAGLDGLIAVNPVNVFYFGNHLGFNSKMQQRNASFAVFPRDKNKPSILVVGSGDLWTISRANREYPNIIPYSVPANWQDFVGHDVADETPQAYPGFSEIWSQNAAGFTSFEKNQIAFEQQFKNEFMPTPEHALVKALKEAGLEKGKVAIDDLSIRSTLARAGHDRTTLIESDNIFRKIRVVKSDVEIGHMGVIAKANQTAAMNMLASLDVGANDYDIDHLFRLEAAKQGAMSTWLVGGSVGGFPDGELRKNVPFLIDAVSQINYYHGDFARTIVFGEPSKKLLDRTKLLNTAWHAVLDIMRPGVRYSEIEKVARKAMAGSGISVPPVGVIPHSVGLQHTDEPYRDNLAFVVKDDLVLQENMTLTVDFPTLEIGWGNCHLEDLVRITKDGVEPLAKIDNPLIIL